MKLMRGRAALLMIALLPGFTAAEAQEIYSANYSDQNVSISDMATLTLIENVPVGGLPTSVALTADHAFALVTVITSDAGETSVDVIKTASPRSVVKSIPVPTVPGWYDPQVFRAPTGGRAYVTSGGFSTVIVLDISNSDVTLWSVETVIDLGPDAGPYPMAFSPDGTIGYVGSGFAGGLPGIYRVNLVDNTLIDVIPTSQGVADLAVSPGGGFALATGGERILVVDLLGDDPESYVMCGGDPCTYTLSGGIGFNALGTRAFVADDANVLIAIDTSNPALVEQLGTAPVPVVNAVGTWTLKVANGCTHVISYGFGPNSSELFTFNTSGDDPVLFASGQVGDFAYEIDAWGLTFCGGEPEPVNQLPDLSAAAPTQACFWPPNHAFAPVGILGVTDPDGDPLTVTITGITSDEPTATAPGTGGSTHAPDAMGVGTNTALIRVERSGRGDGRVYRISFSASDGTDTVTGNVSVGVPKDQRRGGACGVDSGQTYDATAIN